MHTKRTVLETQWKLFGEVMRAQSSASTRSSLDMFLDKQLEEVVSWMLMMATGNHELDAHRAAAYLSTMYHLDLESEHRIKLILKSCLLLCGNS